MLKHVSQTKVMRHFSGDRKSPPKDRDNVIAFPIKHASTRSSSTSIVTTDWKSRLITQRQRSYICWLASQQSISIQSLNKQCFRRYEADLTTMKRTDASDVIHSLKRALSQQYKPFHR